MRYKNRMIINQRGGSIDINNTADSESAQLSHRSGSNILLNNQVNSELATNNKQTKVIHDEFKTVGNDQSEYVGRDKITRVERNTYDLKGFENDEQIQKFKEWKEVYRPIALNNSQFRIQRGGYSSPNGTSTPLNGRRASNPVVSKSKTISVNADFSGYRPVPIRSSMADEVVDYVPIDRRNERASISDISVGDVNASAGASGSSAPGVLEFGASASASTESGVWTENTNSTTIDQQQLQIQETLYSLESQMGDGGDEILTTKRNKFENIGAVFNDYPSIKIDPKGRSQPLEMLVSEKGIYKNHDYIPHVEEVDNSSNFPCGNDIKVVGKDRKSVV